MEEVNLVAILEDLEKSSNRMPAILSVLEDSLLELTHISDPNVRDRAYVLLERLLLHCPRYVIQAHCTSNCISHMSWQSMAGRHYIIIEFWCHSTLCLSTRNFLQ